MSTVLIIVIVVVVLIILAALVALLAPRARVKRRERELDQRREREVGAHREQAQVRQTRAQQAEKQAQLAQAEAQRERAEAELHQTRADVHEKGLADHELVEDHERDRFAGTSAVDNPGQDTGRGRGGDERAGTGRETIRDPDLNTEGRLVREREVDTGSGGGRDVGAGGSDIDPGRDPGARRS